LIPSLGMFKLVVTPPDSQPETENQGCLGKETGLSSAAIQLAREADQHRPLLHTARPPSSADHQRQQSQLSTAAPSRRSSSSLSLSVLSSSPVSSLSSSSSSSSRCSRRPPPLSPVIVVPSVPTSSSPPSPRTLNSPSYRHPSKLFPETLQTDRYGFLLPPRANPDLPKTLEGRGDSFFIDEKRLELRERERQQKLRKGGRQRTSETTTTTTTTTTINSNSNSTADDPTVELASTVDDSLYWSDVIDVVLVVGGALQQIKQRKQPNNSSHRELVETATNQHSEEKMAECATSQLQCRYK